LRGFTKLAFSKGTSRPGNAFCSEGLGPTLNNTTGKGGEVVSEKDAGLCGAPLQTLGEKLADAAFRLGLIRLKELRVYLGSHIRNRLILRGTFWGIHTKDLSVRGGYIKARHSLDPRLNVTGQV
jgi:hypothetical protein